MEFNNALMGYPLNKSVNDLQSKADAIKYAIEFAEIVELHGSNKVNYEAAQELYDITHCNNESCPAKDRCLRYRAHLDNIRDGHPFCSYLSLSDEQKERVQRLGSCLHFSNYQNNK